MPIAVVIIGLVIGANGEIALASLGVASGRFPDGCRPTPAPGEATCEVMTPTPKNRHSTASAQRL